MLDEQKSGVSQLLLRFLIKKRDCTVAVPLIEALVLPYLPNKQHRAHADMYNHAHTHLRRAQIWIYIPRGHQNAAMSWKIFEFTRFQLAKNKALITPLLCLVTAHPKDIIPRRELITGANIQHFFDMTK